MDSPDLIDLILAGWREQLPGLDPSPLELVGRVLVLAQKLEKSVNQALAVHDKLTLGQFDILGTLRRHGPAGGLTPGQLLKNVTLSSGGMTARLDRLEADGLVRRRADPTDRRGVVVELTDHGRELIDAAAATRFAEARRSQPTMSDDDRRTLACLLRRWLRETADDPGRAS